jgi:hypothetical protein
MTRMDRANPQERPRFLTRIDGRVVVTISSIERAVDGDGGAGAAADYVVSRADRPTAHTRGDYCVGDDHVESDARTLWHGAPAALSQLGVDPGAAVERDALVAALQGRHVVSGAQVRRPGQRGVERDGELVVERVVKSVDLTFSVPKSVSVVWPQAGAEERQRIKADVLAAAQETIDFMATTRCACTGARRSATVSASAPRVSRRPSRCM